MLLKVVLEISFVPAKAVAKTGAKKIVFVPTVAKTGAKTGAKNDAKKGFILFVAKKLCQKTAAKK